MDVISKISIAAIPILLSIIGFLLIQVYSKINLRIADIKGDIKEFKTSVTNDIKALREDIGNAINNTGILSEEIISMEKQCEIRHKTK